MINSGQILLKGQMNEIEIRLKVDWLDKLYWYPDTRENEPRGTWSSYRTTSYILKYLRFELPQFKGQSQQIRSAQT